MKLSHINIILTTSLIFILFSCRESWVKTNDRIPTKDNQGPLRKEKDTIRHFKEDLKEHTPKTKRDRDTLKPRIASDLKLRQNILEITKS